MVGKAVTLDISGTLADCKSKHNGKLPFDEGIYLQVQSAVRTHMRDLELPNQLVENEMQKVQVMPGARYKWDDDGKHREVFVRASTDFNNDGPWHDAALIEYETGDENSTSTQMGYVLVYACLVVANQKLLFVRWFTNLPESRDNENIFASTLHRHLPALTWNMRTRTCDRSFQMLTPECLRFAAWVVPDLTKQKLFWHIKPRNLHVHQDPEQLTL